MNILIPHNWLQEHLETTAKPEEIQKYVSLCGPSVERIYDREGEPVYDIEVTTNRVDSMSVRGIAREVAVILKQFGLPAMLKQQPDPSFVQNDSLPLPAIFNNPKLCKRIHCVVLSNVKRTPTPEWMAKRLRQTDQTVHDSVIDITNYITHELGHPCHAFDYDKVMALGGEIHVTVATTGEQFTTLDDQTYTTVGGEIVFKNQHGTIIDLPAIKGTANTSISETTKNVLLWTETLDAQKVRFASMTHAIRTVAAQLSEKHVDPHLAKLVVNRGIELYQELCHAHIASEIYDDFPGKVPTHTITVPLSRITEYLGITIEPARIVAILEDLECAVALEKNSIQVTPPTFRPDITIPADCIEEIARIYGYHNVPSVLMDTRIPTAKPEATNFVLENRIKHYLTAIGWQELYTYSMVSTTLALESGWQLNEHLALQNPLTDDRVYLRRSLIPSLEEIIAQNSREDTLSVFEVANVYHPRENDLPKEELMLSLVSTLEYSEVKGVLESLLAQFFIDEVTVTPQQVTSAPSISQQGIVKVDDRSLGTIAVLNTGHTAIELSVSKVLSVAKTHPTYKSIPKTTEIKEDLTFTFADQTPLGEVIAAIKTNNPLVSSVELKDMYHQNGTLAISYWDNEHNLSSEEIEPLRKKIVEEVEKTFGAHLVGTV